MAANKGVSLAELALLLGLGSLSMLFSSLLSTIRRWLGKPAIEPVVEEPVVEEPVVEEPVVEEPVVEEPVVEEPVVEEPVAEEPVAEEPVAEEPPPAPEKSTMRYIRSYLSEEGPGVTLHEVDPCGRVHRRVSICAEGLKFAPEAILIMQPVDLHFLLSLPSTDEVSEDDFTVLWDEVREARPFRRCLPNPEECWLGYIAGPEKTYRVLWAPYKTIPKDSALVPVPGFSDLYVRGSAENAWSVYSLLFLMSPTWGRLATDQDIYLLSEIPRFHIPLTQTYGRLITPLTPLQKLNGI